MGLESFSEFSRLDRLGKVAMSLTVDSSLAIFSLLDFLGSVATPKYRVGNGIFLIENQLGVTSFDKICVVQLSDEIGEGGYEILKKQTLFLFLNPALW